MTTDHDFERIRSRGWPGRLPVCLQSLMLRIFQHFIDRQGRIIGIHQGDEAGDMRGGERGAAVGPHMYYAKRARLPPSRNGWVLATGPRILSPGAERHPPTFENGEMSSGWRPTDSTTMIFFSHGGRPVRHSGRAQLNGLEY